MLFSSLRVGGNDDVLRNCLVCGFVCDCCGVCYCWLF